MVESVLKLLESIATIVVLKEKTKYQDQIIRIKKEWNEENAKDEAHRSNAVLDNLKRELRDLVDSFSAQVGGS